ncbi:hypothetical protein ACQ5SO_21135 [Rhodovulum sp. DZ06]|uniref:hypothetical protein n=1 Tax=Rhodovulum sp. DZ06 TaxID=3425126 RepID=UPI003D3337B4
MKPNRFAALAAAALCALSFAVTPAPAAASDDDDDDAPRLGRAGLLSGANKEDLPRITLSAGMPLLDSGEITLKSGRYYEVVIACDGSAELAVEGAGFFRAIWIDEIIINDIEIRAMAVDSIEFDDEGEVEIGFVAVKPGTYELRVPGGGESQRVKIVIE